MQVDPRVLDTFGDAIENDSTDMVDVLWQYVAPEMASMERARRATLLTAASPRDRNGYRGRLHTLLAGEAGTGKSVLRDWLASALDAAKLGPKSTQAGLKGSSSGQTYTPGALATQNGNHIALDELDEFDRRDRGALLEAMAEGEYHVNAAGIDRDIPAEVTVVAACNRTSEFRDELLDRFDFVVDVEEYDADDTVEVTDTVYDGWADAFDGQGSGVEANPLVSYLPWVRTYEVEIDPSVVEECTDVATYLVREHGETGDIRGKEAILRAAYTWARLNREPLSQYHYLRAAAFIHPEYAADLRETFPEYTRSE